MRRSFAPSWTKWGLSLTLKSPSLRRKSYRTQPGPSSFTKIYFSKITPSTCLWCTATYVVRSHCMRCWSFTRISSHCWQWCQRLYSSSRGKMHIHMAGLYMMKILKRYCTTMMENQIMWCFCQTDWWCHARLATWSIAEFTYLPCKTCTQRLSIKTMQKSIKGSCRSQKMTTMRGHFHNFSMSLQTSLR